MSREEATKKAKALKRRMSTPGWKIRVWENCGWHYEIRNGYIYVSPVTYGEKGEFMAGMATEIGASGTPSVWHKLESFKDPNKAVSKQLNRAATFSAQLTRIIEYQIKRLGG